MFYKKYKVDFVLLQTDDLRLLCDPVAIVVQLLRHHTSSIKDGVKTKNSPRAKLSTDQVKTTVLL